jgi:uncharacterized protein YwqG
MDIDKLRAMLEEIGLEKYFDLLQQNSKNTIRLYLQKAVEEKISVGQSKIGGRPDLPKEISWPTQTNDVIAKADKFGTVKQVSAIESLSFVAQINLTEASQYDTENLLPKSGLLYFFYSASQDAWGLDCQDKDAFRVIFWDGNFDELQRADFPNDLDDYARYKACTVEMKPEISLPSEGDEIYNDFTEDESYEFWENYVGEMHRILGYPDIIQDNMEVECETAINKIFYSDQVERNEPKTLKSNAKEWRLLFQIDTNETSEMTWGDCGRLYFWIKKDDLLNKNFEKSWFGLQCY